MASRRCERGFTLIETLVAFVLLSLSLALIMQIFSSGLRNNAASEQLASAAVVADGLLNSLGLEAPIEQGEQQGESGPYHWRIKITPAEPDEAQSSQISNSYRLYRIELVLEWRQGARARQLELTTLRLGGGDA